MANGSPFPFYCDQNGLKNGVARPPKHANNPFPTSQKTSKKRRIHSIGMVSAMKAVDALVFYSLLESFEQPLILCTYIWTLPARRRPEVWARSRRIRRMDDKRGLRRRARRARRWTRPQRRTRRPARRWTTLQKDSDINHLRNGKDENLNNQGDF